MACTEGSLKTSFLLVLPTMLFLLAMTGASRAGSDPNRNVTPGEAQALILKNKGNGNFVVLDVRTPGEFAKGHIEGAVLVDYRSAGFRKKMADFDREKTYLVYCRTGNRSTRALGIMRDLDFRSYYHLEGGITRWVEDKLPTVQ